MEQALNIVHQLYRKDKLIPFIGAGLSYPFNIPTWGNMILDLSNEWVDPALRPAIEFEITKRKNYWKAIDNLLDYSDMAEFDLQQAIVDLMTKKQKKFADVLDHNYIDIGMMNFKIHLTTNYDYLIHKFMQADCHLPLMMSACNLSTQEISVDPKKRIFHLHGHMSDTGSIVISRKKYEEIYSDEKYRQLFGHFCGSYTFLFMGFSFDDQYIRELIKRYKDFFNSKHFIILDQPTPEIIKELKQDYFLEVLPYDSTTEGHVGGIRRILNYLKLDGSVEIATEDIDEFLLPPEVNKNQLELLESNLFAKKLKLEEIDSNIIELSKEFYYYADTYIRRLRKKRLSEELIHTILTICFMKYKVIRTEYISHKDSQRFVNEVHESFGSIDYGRIKQYLEKVSPLDLENKGFAHILADDEEKDVWWGEKRMSGDDNEPGANSKTS